MRGDRGSLRAHWDDVHSGASMQQPSWFQPQAQVSITLVKTLGVTPGDAVVDVGGGSSRLVDDLLVRRFHDITVLDISPVALAAAQTRLAAVSGVEWIAADLLRWRPSRTFALWHDRAVLHFLTADADRDRYLSVLRAATAVGSGVVIGVFAADGATSCSGLPTRRYTAEALLELLGDGFAEVATVREEHMTPAGAVQPFTWLAARRTDLAPDLAPDRA